jgi:hypothetical protein
MVAVFLLFRPTFIFYTVEEKKKKKKIYATSIKKNGEGRRVFLLGPYPRTR